MVGDSSNGWDDIAGQFITARSTIGASVVRDWANEHIRKGGDILDVGCGSGAPNATALIELGYRVYGVDPSPKLIAAFQRHCPQAVAACESAQESAFFNRQFDGAIAIGLIFLLIPDDQKAVIRRIGQAIKPGGRFLFTAPKEICEWQDALTKRTSRSLGAIAYKTILQDAGFALTETHTDEGGNFYFDAVRRG